MRWLTLKKIVLSFVILIIWSTPSSGEVYSSAFGFSINIPSHWKVLDRYEVKSNPDVLDFSGRKNMSKALINEIKGKILSGEVEYYFLQNIPINIININVFKYAGQLPTTLSGVNDTCRRNREDAYKHIGERTKFYECRLRNAAGLNVLYMDYELVYSSGETARLIQYQIQKSGNVIVTLTLACYDQQQLGIIRKEFEDIIASFNPLMK